MPLHDHFRPPLDDAHSWEELHGQWPAVIVQQLRKRLPAGYTAAPRVHAGLQVEIDIATFHEDDPPSRPAPDEGDGGDEGCSSRERYAIRPVAKISPWSVLQ